MEEGYDNINKPEATTDPFEYMQKWRDSEVYKRSCEKFFDGKQLSDDVTEQEKREAYEDSFPAKLSLLNFSKTAQGNFKYDSLEYPKDTAEKIGNYVETVEYVMKRMREGAEADEIKEMDLYRSVVHHETAKSLVEEGIAPNEKIGRTFARLVLISKGLDTHSDASRPDVDRVWGIVG